MVGNSKFRLALAVLGALAGLVGAGESAGAEPLTVGAPPSMRAAFEEIVPLFEKEYGAPVRVVYSPSKTLYRQIVQGVPIDVFLAAGVEEVEDLHKKGLTLSGGPRVYGQTSLVLVASTGSVAISPSFRDALPDRATRIALGDPKTSSLGEITARALTRLDPGYRNRPRMFHGQHGEDIVNLIQTRKVDMGIVYRVDAISSGHVRIIDEAPAGTHTPVQFGQAVVWTCRKESLVVAGEFFEFIMSPRIQKLLLKYGFDSMPSNG